MLSQRRTAQFGLWAACLILVLCITVLVAGASDDGSQAGSTALTHANMQMSSHVGTLAAGQVGSQFSSLQSETAQPVASIRQ